MRLLLVGAFPYPHDQGSQIYFQEQARALRSAGADVSLLTYATRTGPDAERDPALAGLDHWCPPSWTSPRSLRSGPSWEKPLADLGLAMTLRDAVASKARHDAFDAILTHNAEAAVAALAALGSRSQRRPPIVYCAHTLLEQELRFYLKPSKDIDFSSSRSELSRSLGWRALALERLGGMVDRGIARRVEGWIALTQTSTRVMRQFSRAPGALIPPPIPDPELRSVALDPAAAADRHGLEPGRFFLYSGNLDGYQELDILAAVAAEARRRGSKCPLVIASHAGPARGAAPRDSSAPAAGIRRLQVDSAFEMLGLLAAARASLVLRRSAGGFPIKLANSLSLGTPPIAFRSADWGLSDGRDSVVCSPEQPVTSLARAIERLEVDDAEVARLSAGARALYDDRHRPERAAARTLDLLEEILVRRRR
jgi:glycosyltransferase involved in cell wall biosynthesis